MTSAAIAGEDIEPVVHIRGRIILWKCSRCRWTRLLSPKFTGLKPSADVIRAYREHRCEDHRGR